MTQIKLIWAQSRNGTIGRGGMIPWHQRADMQLFRRETTGKVVLMGRKTMESLNGRPLPNRVNLVLTHRAQMDLPAGFQKVAGIDDAIDFAKRTANDLVIIGGKAIYEASIKLADELLITYLETKIDGDVSMAPINESAWSAESVLAGPADEQNDYAYRVVRYQRR